MTENTVVYKWPYIAVRGPVVPDIVTSVAGAKQGTAQGEPVAAVLHTLDNARALAALGVRVASPIVHDPRYAWGGRHAPFDHQRITSSMMTLYPRMFVLNDPGTGKTRSAIWATEYLRAAGEITGTLIVAPLSTLTSVWRDEIFNVNPRARVVVLTGARKTRVALLQTMPDYAIINHDGLKLIEKELIAARINHVIYDEATAIKHTNSQRWKATNNVCRGRGVWAMTGTPIAQSPTDAYGLGKLVVPARVPTSFKRFQDLVCFPVNEAKYVPRANAPEIVRDVLQPAVRFSKAECLDLPPVTHMPIGAPLSADQTKVIRSLITGWAAETAISGRFITVANAAVRMNKIMQICQGAVKDELGAVHRYDVSPRLQVVTDIVDGMRNKLLIFAPFTASIDLLVQHLRRHLGNNAAVESYDGRNTNRQRQALVSRFQNPNDPLKIMVLQPAAAAHGLTLTEADTIIWFGPLFSAEQYLQANARTDRPGQKHNVTIYEIAEHAVEKEIFNGLRNRKITQDQLLKLYERLTTS